jgi:hypothetical protein
VSTGSGSALPTVIDSVISARRVNSASSTIDQPSPEASTATASVSRIIEAIDACSSISRRRIASSTSGGAPVPPMVRW